MLICDDCAIAATNDDFTGMDEATEARVRAGLERTGHVYVSYDDFGPMYHDFSTRPCDCCETRLAGGRFEAQAV